MTPIWSVFQPPPPDFWMVMIWRSASRLKALPPRENSLWRRAHIRPGGEGLLDDYEAIDYLCLGEGEVTLAELASGKAPAHVEGLAWRDGDRAVLNPPRPQIFHSG
jgi:anaerobic magnesium-protoporphyrin IX monomethyl ester cyclase